MIEAKFSNRYTGSYIPNITAVSHTLREFLVPVGPSHLGYRRSKAARYGNGRQQQTL